ncbi:family transcriptional regulator : Transcriptional regulator, ArsR family OS=Chondromyces apiculatus DSM 436 GN=CAP_2205 PE=4 SV=1: HTH_20 [Gemmataceae bacterium]|nr:family transcriptional regulator : Transcriptional regulator, ArsR family OS=Chondromyces apiculatus DSM 436 GN=CAP_2205 PE=4 SV=1: HTH_20 [Gemmataceae bacterium]VTU00083.1 family transcriptional regulator : Transcriptional regulator, ArsR family OS=Chondromyces apiculatus DSM 436 GN=CAP_2205 PE=4 SV=1: HTH_20 [Gemmataceae bacterium]
MKSRNGDPRSKPNQPTCSHEHAALLPGAPAGAKCLERAARLFSALGDAQRLRVLHLLMAGEVCVSTIVATLGEKFPTVSQRLRVLRSEGLVARRREGSHVYYALADGHVRDLVSNALAHAEELDRPAPNPNPNPEDEE